MSEAPSSDPVAVRRRGRAAHLGPERRRPLVLDAALRLFVDRGYAGTTMDAIAEAAGVTKPVVYECYPGKSALFRALLEREERRLLDAVASALPRDRDADDIEALAVSSFTAVLRAVAAAPDSWRVAFGAAGGGEPEVARRFQRGRAAIVDQLAGLVAELPGDGATVDRRLAGALAELLASLGEGGVRVLLEPGSDWSADDLGRLLGGLAAGALESVARSS